MPIKDTPLCRLAFQHNTDKAGSYTRLYDSLLFHRRLEVRKVLEIGIGSIPAMQHVAGYIPGASLRMWRDYFPQAVIYGLDIDPGILIQEERIQTRLCDQGKVEDLMESVSWTGSPLDLVIDDGSHDPDHQLQTAITLMPYMASGGLYIIEDVNDLDSLSRRIPFEHACTQYKYASPLIGRLILIPT